MPEQKDKNMLWFSITAGAAVAAIIILISQFAAQQNITTDTDNNSAQSDTISQTNQTAQLPIQQNPNKKEDTDDDVNTGGNPAQTREERNSSSVSNTNQIARAPAPQQPATKETILLSDVVNNARDWAPSFTSWYGKAVPDFILRDLDDRPYKISDYRGKNVILVFWATWCRPCRSEIPHIIALRKNISTDKLAVLAISNEDPAMLKKFAAANNINYTVLSNRNPMPSPFNQINTIPTSFFINPDGKIKLATVGSLSLGSMKAIIQAE
jgi:peroxiredoxin